MKTRSFLYLFVAVVISMTAACVNDQQNDNAGTTAEKNATAQDPGEFLKDFFEVWNSGNIDSSMTMIYQAVNMNVEEKAKLKQGLQLGYKELQDENGGIKNIKIMHQERNEEGDEIMVTYIVEYVNGGAKEVTRKIVKHEGKWMLSL